MVACKSACSAGSATFTTVPSMNAMLDPRIVAANAHAPRPAQEESVLPANITAWSHGNLAPLVIILVQNHLFAEPRAFVWLKDCRSAIVTAFNVMSSSLSRLAAH